MSFRNRLLQLTLVVLGLAIGTQAQEKESCSNATLHGSYGLHATGTVNGVGALAVVGRFTFDGKGTLTGRLWVVVNGDTSGAQGTPDEFTGTYSVHPDCTVSDEWPVGTGNTHVSVIVDNGKGYFILANGEGGGATISAEARRQ
jgi:hypothetical protein